MTREILNHICRALTFALSFLLGSCITLYPSPPPGVDPELKEYVERFEQYAREYYGESYKIPPIDIGFGDTASLSMLLNGPNYTTVGWCNKFVNPIQILIDKDSWSYYSDIRKEQLMFHELAHCALNRPHIEVEDPENFPVSMMFPVLLNDTLYKTYRDKYIRELFLCDVDSKKIKNKDVKYNCGGSVLE